MVTWGAVSGLMSWFHRRELPVQIPKFRVLELGRIKTSSGHEQVFRFAKLPGDYCGCRGPASPEPILLSSCLKDASIVASVSENYYALFEKEWLRTVMNSDDVLQQQAGREIHSNVVPQQAYTDRLEDGQRNCLHNGPQDCTEGFFRIPLPPGSEIPEFGSCSKCALLKQLRIEKNGTPAAGVATSHSGQPRPVEEIILENRDIDSKKGPIGGGNEGFVYTIKLSNETFAMKEFQPGLKVKFDRGRDIASRIIHPNIVRCIRVQIAHELALLTELLEEDLESFLCERARDPDGSELPFSFRDSLSVLLQIAEAMKHLHENYFLHGDLKPANILVSKLPMAHSGVPFYLVKVADFGCIKPTDRDPPTNMAEWGIGTKHYTAPEVLKCRRKTSPKGPVPNRQHLEKIDVYSFAIIAFQVLTGVTDLYPDYWKQSLDSVLSFCVCGLKFQLHIGMSKKERKQSKELDEKVIDGLRPDLGSKGGALDKERLELLDFIKKCWDVKPEDRPSFSDICEHLEEAIKGHRLKGQNEIGPLSGLSRTLQFMGYTFTLLSFLCVLKELNHHLDTAE